MSSTLTLERHMAKVFQTSKEATEKTVIIQIAEEDLVTLKDNNYKLCFAKKVNDTYNVVWQSLGDYLVTNSFSWVPMYELFASNTFESEVTVEVTTNIVDIGLGEESTLNSAGLLSDPVTGGPSDSVTMINEYGPIHPGMNQLSTSAEGTISTPIYVAEYQAVLGSVELTPIEYVMVWFEQNIETSTMFSTARSNSIEINMTGVDEQTRLYENGTWSTP